MKHHNSLTKGSGEEPLAKSQRKLTPIIPHRDLLDSYVVTVHRDLTTALGSRHVDFSIQLKEDKFRPLFGLRDIMEFLEKLFENILMDLLQDAEPEDRIRFIFRSPLLADPISIPVLPVSSLSLELILTAIANVLNSYESFCLDSSVKINFVHVKVPKNGGVNPSGSLTVRQETDLFAYIKKKKCIISEN